MGRTPNGFYSFSDSYFKRRNKKDLINYIRTIEKNWENALITNDIQYSNCKRLLAEEYNKAIDEFLERLRDAENFSELPDGTRTTAVEMCEVEAIAEELKSDRVDTYK